MISELVKTNTKLESCAVTIHKTNVDKESLSAKIENLKTQIANLTNVEIAKYKDLKRDLEMEVTKLRDRNKDLEELYVYMFFYFLMRIFYFIIIKYIIYKLALFIYWVS